MLEVGTHAPDFSLRDQHGRTIALSRLAGERHALVVFFPAAFTSVCDAELRELRDWWPEHGRDDTDLIGISCDPMFSLRGYSDSEGIDFPLLSDFWPHGAVCRDYGVFDERSGTAERSSYLVGRDGQVAWSVHNARGDGRPLAGYERALARLHP